MKTELEIRNRNEEIDRDRQNLLLDYAISDNEKEKEIIHSMNLREMIRIKDLKWVLNE